ncbi:MAG: hypothetical protein E5X48_10590 [Mesorhizobium sp.]|uniref:hypothetical protein n=1 Tax=Mesorhizobium sp. TaxID=1871066 RepID=UPI00121F64B1|nr:hypothetical protein [Mesorhizobium sp.]TIQ36234.1 MAG: hypothetical protein E5X48_10590 [Mesorhizobium sp.]
MKVTAAGIDRNKIGNAHANGHGVQNGATAALRRCPNGQSGAGNRPLPQVIYGRDRRCRGPFGHRPKNGYAARIESAFRSIGPSAGTWIRIDSS